MRAVNELAIASDENLTSTWASAVTVVRNDGLVILTSGN
jgi:hypothetical protein